MYRPSTKGANLHRSSSYEPPPPRPAPLSPPETELEPALAAAANESFGGSDVLPAHAETPAQRFRRLAYNTSTTVLTREQRAPQRQTKWLIMVVPPSSLNEPPLLGHTLSSAPTGRFSHGILMPLFPTLYGQLTAIAREFNMPSTTGLCIYLQVLESGIPMMTPRVSDETWQILWAQYFSGESSTSHGLPIAGRIEFDIDMRRAKWFNTWMGLAARAESEAPLSREPSMVPSHWRGESRSSLLVPDPIQSARDESPSPPEATPTANQPFRQASQRQVPRPLLLERREAGSTRSFSRHGSRGQNLSVDIAVEPPIPASTTTEPTFVPNALSPAVQEVEEPPTAKPNKSTELDHLVQKWRQSSVTGGPTSAVSAAGQPSLDAVNMPAGADVELDLDDFSWSISSAGPPTESPISPNWPSPLPSIHLVGRMAGSVCLTPTTCTSWGPPSYPSSPASYASRQPSVDLGQRMEEFVPLTPSTATSWGPEDLPSPLDYQEISRPPSIDLGLRGMGSVPVTPSTATTWGPEDLPSPLYYQEIFRPPSVDIGLRGMGSVPVTPSTATSWGPPDTPLYMPATPDYVRSPDAGERSFPDFELPQRSVPNMSFPYYDAWTTQPWNHVWPYHTRLHPQRQEESTEPPSRELSQEYPDFAGLYPPSQATGLEIQLHGSSGYPSFELYPAVYPYNLRSIYPSVGPVTRDMENVGHVASVEITLHVSYPAFEIYVPVYPFNMDNIYPAVSTEKASSSVHQLQQRLPEYPDFANLYPSDPKAELVGATKRQPVCGPYIYPFIEIYPAVYPYNLVEIYAPVAPRQAVRQQQKELLPEYPDFAALYPADQTVELAGQVKAQPVSLYGQTWVYPELVIYPAVYPFSLERIYAPVNRGVAAVSLVQRSVKVEKTVPAAPSGMSFPYYDPWTTKPWNYVWPYQEKSTSPWEHVWPYQATAAASSSKEAPSLDYPDFAGLYPADVSAERVGENKAQPVSLPTLGYPSFNVYPSVYPYSVYEIYGRSTLSVDVSSQKVKTVRRSLSLDYPDFAGLYPQDPKAERVGMNKAQPVTLPELGYPSINVYPAVYPHSIYEVYERCVAVQETSAVVASRKGGLPEYPDFCGLYPEDPRVERAGMNKAQGVALRERGYPNLVIYPSVYPYSIYEVYGRCVAVQETSVVVASRKGGLPEYPDFCGLYPEDPRVERAGMNKAQGVALRERGYPNLVIYPSVYPYSIYEIYGPSSIYVPRRKAGQVGIDVKIPVYQGYPVFNLYPMSSGYPTFELYPPIMLPESSQLDSISVKLPSSYPALQVYEPVYPHLVIYPLVVVIDEIKFGISIQADVLPCLYPTIQIYKPVYPHFDLYPAVEVPMAQRSLELPVRLLALYPAMQIYEAVYPHLVIYPPVVVNDPFQQRRRPKRTHHELHVMVFGKMQPTEKTQQTPVYLPRRRPRRTHHELHMMVFGAKAEEAKEAPTEPSQPVYMPRKKPRRTHHELHLMVFPTQGEQELKETLAKFPMPPMPPLPSLPPLPPLPSMSLPIPPTPPTPPAHRTRGRSGTVSQRPMTAHASLRQPVSTVVEQGPAPSRSSPTSKSIASPFASSPSRTPGSSARVSPISPAESASPSSPSRPRPMSTAVRGLPFSPAQTRSSVVGLPSSPAANILTRVRSMNNRNRPSTSVSPVSSEGSGLDRSKSMSEATMLNRRSIVQDRARLFSGGDSPRGSSNDDDTHKAHLPSRPISKLDRSKIPFA